MPNIINIPTPLRPFTDKKEAVEVSGATVGELLSDLTTRYEGLRKHLYADNGKLRNFVNVYLNDEDIRYLQREATPVKAGDTLSIVPSVAGGAPTTAAPPETDLSQEEIKRYSRHLIMPEVGIDGQRKLKASSVLCIGAGGLGGPAAAHPAAPPGRGRRPRSPSPPPVSDESASWTLMSSTSATCSVSCSMGLQTSVGRS